MFRLLLLSTALVSFRTVAADALHTPAERTAERQAILATLHQEYTTDPAVK